MLFSVLMFFASLSYQIRGWPNDAMTNIDGMAFAVSITVFIFQIVTKKKVWIFADEGD